MWRNFIKRVFKETELKEPLTEHDIRANYATDTETFEHIKALLAHADAEDLSAKTGARETAILR
jgi:hypothetical protein